MRPLRPADLHDLSAARERGEVTPAITRTYHACLIDARGIVVDLLRNAPGDDELLVRYLERTLAQLTVRAQARLLECDADV